MTAKLLRGTRAIADYLQQDSHVTIQNWIKNEGLPVTWLGNAYCTTGIAIDSWLAARLKTTPHRRPRTPSPTKPE